MDRYKFFKHNAQNNRTLRIEERCGSRKDQRSMVLDKLRNIASCETPKALVEHKDTQEKVVKKSRLELLKEWKAQKAKKAKEEKNKKKPVFVAGKVHYNAKGSPVVKKNALNDVTNALPRNTRNRVMTRAHAKAINTVKATEHQIKRFEFKQLNKVVDKHFHPVQKHDFVVPKVVNELRQNLTVSISPKLTKRQKKSLLPVIKPIAAIPKTQKKASQQRIENNNTGLTNTATNDQSNMEVIETLCVTDFKQGSPLNRREFVNSKSENNTEGLFNKEAEVSNLMSNNRRTSEARMTNNSTLVSISVSDEKCSKENKEEKHRKAKARETLELEHLVNSPYVEMERGSKRRSLSRKSTAEKIEEEIAFEEKLVKSSVADFRLFLLNETERLTAQADQWKSLENSENIPADVVGEIAAACGKTMLLTSDKFRQFESLIDRFEAGDECIRIDDLRGFQDWVALEVTDLDKLFLALKERSERNWVDPIVEKITLKPLKVKAPTPKRPKKVAAVSNMRAHILAARQKMLSTKSSGDATPIISVTESVAKSPLVSDVTSAITTRKRTLDASNGLISMSNTCNEHPSGELSCAVESDKMSKIYQELPKNVTSSANDVRGISVDCSSVTPRKSKTSTSGRLSSHTSCIETPLRKSNLYKKSLLRRCSGLEIVAASSRGKSPCQMLAVTPEKPSSLNTTLTPSRSILRTTYVPPSARKNVSFIGLDPKYLQPEEESPVEETPSVVMMLSGGSEGLPVKTLRTPSSVINFTSTPLVGGKAKSTRLSFTPVRRSSRIAGRNANTSSLLQS